MLLSLASGAGTAYWWRSMAADLPMPGGWTLSMVWLPMPGQPRVGAAALFLAMWVVMMVAMMLPPLVPMLATLNRRGLAVLAGAGYFSVWALFGAAVHLGGGVITGAELRWPAVARLAPLATGAVLLGAGCLQLTAWKGRRLARCRACEPPRSALPAGAFRHGLRYGVQCALCCSGLMAILLVAGMMRLAVVAAVAAAISLERLSPGPQLVARASGTIAMVTGAVVVARALGAGL